MMRDPERSREDGASPTVGSEAAAGGGQPPPAAPMNPGQAAGTA
jgi:hypothetical protein